MHVLARLQGFGLTLVPKAPYRIERAADAPTTELRIVHGERSESLDVREVLSGERATELADIEAGDPRERWGIETGVTSCAWPEGFALCSDPDELSPFLLLGPDDAMIWIAGPLDPAETTPIEKLAVDGQTIRAVAQTGADQRIDLDYEVDGEPWWQRRYVIAWPGAQTILICGQARKATEPLVSAAVDLIEASLEPTRRE